MSLTRRALVAAPLAALVGTPVASPPPAPAGDREHPLPFGASGQIGAMQLTILAPNPAKRKSPLRQRQVKVMAGWESYWLKVEFLWSGDEPELALGDRQFVLHGASGNYYPYAPVIFGPGGTVNRQHQVAPGVPRPFWLAWEIRPQDRDGALLEVRQGDRRCWFATS